MNSVNLIGRLTRDPELRHTPSGTAVCGFSIAVDRAGPQGDDGKPEAGFFDCVAWGNLAETIQQYFHKGKQIAVSGELRWSKWQTQDNQTRTKVEVNVRNMTFVGPKDSDGGGSSNQFVPAGAQQGSGGGWGDFPAATDDDIPF